KRPPQTWQPSVLQEDKGSRQPALALRARKSGWPPISKRPETGSATWRGGTVMKPCSPISTLRQLLDDVLPEAAIQTVYDHVGRCTQCQTVLEPLSEDEELRGWAVAGDPSTPLPAGDAALAGGRRELRPSEQPTAAEQAERRRYAAAAVATLRTALGMDPKLAQGWGRRLTSGNISPEDVNQN